jgi:hypothetical protein
LAARSGAYKYGAYKYRRYGDAEGRLDVEDSGFNSDFRPQTTRLESAAAAAAPEANKNTLRLGCFGLRAAAERALYTLTPAHVTNLTIVHDKHDDLSDEPAGMTAMGYTYACQKGAQCRPTIRAERAALRHTSV